MQLPRENGTRNETKGESMWIVGKKANDFGWNIKCIIVYVV